MGECLFLFAAQRRGLEKQALAHASKKASFLNLLASAKIIVSKNAAQCE
jgi:hypothetical protein